MRRFALSLIILASVIAPIRFAQADDMEKVMRLWCTQAGTWTGKIDVTAANGKTNQLELGSKPNKSKVLSVESDNDSLSPSVYGEGEDDEKQLVLAQ